jgi:hypothetical protein
MFKWKHSATQRSFRGSEIRYLTLREEHRKGTTKNGELGDY